MLDIGCGDGRATALIAERLPQGSVLGVDKSASMIALAAEQFPPDAHPHLTFRRMDATRLALPRAFDVAFSSAALHWVDDHQAMLRGVRSCLRPGGRLLFQMGGRGNIVEALAVVEEVIARPRWRDFFDGFIPPYHFHSPEEYEEWLPRAGFCVARAELIPKDMRHVDDRPSSAGCAPPGSPTPTACRRSFATPFSTMWPPHTPPRIPRRRGRDPRADGTAGSGGDGRSGLTQVRDMLECTRKR